VQETSTSKSSGTRAEVRTKVVNVHNIISSQKASGKSLDGILGSPRKEKINQAEDLNCPIHCFRN
jgi:hypothetical protein